MDALTCAIIGHLVGDYLLQNDWMAAGKKTNSFICAIHAQIWTCCVLIFAGWTTWSHPLQTVLIAHALLFAMHFAQDRGSFVVWWMKRMGQSKFMQCDQITRFIDHDDIYGNVQTKITPGLGPWSIIVVDNVWHIVQIWAVWKFIIN